MKSNICSHLLPEQEGLGMGVLMPRFLLDFTIALTPPPMMTVNLPCFPAIIRNDADSEGIGAPTLQNSYDHSNKT
jgi:hypothetical protein